MGLLYLYVVKQLLCTLAGLLGQILLKANIKSFLHSFKQHITGKYGGMEVLFHALQTSKLGCHRPESLPSHLPLQNKPTISLDYSQGRPYSWYRFCAVDKNECLSRELNLYSPGVWPLICLHSGTHFDFKAKIK
jgi:hypothetical protein